MAPAEGVEFLAMETGLAAAADLAPEGRALARKVGYEKLALQIVGAMRVPINPKLRAPMSWAEIEDYVDGIRAELGLGADALGAEA